MSVAQGFTVMLVAVAKNSCWKSKHWSCSCLKLAFSNHAKQNGSCARRESWKAATHVKLLSKYKIKYTVILIIYKTWFTRRHIRIYDFFIWKVYDIRIVYVFALRSNL